MLREKREMERGREGGTQGGRGRAYVNRETSGKEEGENLNDPRLNCFAVNTEIQCKTHLMGSIFYYTMLNN